MNFDKPSKRLKSQNVIEINGARVAQNEYVDDENDLSDYVAVPFKIIKEKHAPTSEPCWGCIFKFRKPEEPGLDPLLDKLYPVYEKNVATTSPEIAARLIAKEFRETIYIPMKEQGEECMEWPEHVILQHIQGKHMLMKNIEIEKSIMTLSIIENELRDALFMHKDGKSGLRVDAKQADVLCKIIATKQKLIKDSSS